MSPPPLKRWSEILRLIHIVEVIYTGVKKEDGVYRVVKKFHIG